MTNLRKYYNDEIKPTELQALKTEEKQKTDAELSEELSNLWEEEMKVADSSMTDRLQDIRLRIMDGFIEDKTEEEKSSHALLRRMAWITSIAASVMLVLLIGLGYRYHSYKQTMLAQEITVSTQVGELAQVVLPDGTHIKLAGASVLSYPSAFDKEFRKVHFEGEAYFEVTHDARHPFLVEMDNLEVKVKGTKFNLRCRHQEALTSLSLQEGCVELTSALSGKSVTLFENQKAIVDTKTGHISVSDVEDIAADIAWTNHLMAFRNQPFRQVMEEIAQNYGLTLVIGSKVPNDTFTGTLPNNRMEEVISTLEIIFKVKIRVSNGKLIVNG